MDMEYFEYIIKNEEILKKINQAETMDEAQLIALFLIRNNLSLIRNDIKGIHGWIIFFGFITILGIVASLFI
jgi:hypothetical protein